MAQFMAIISGSRGEASRLGTAKSGIMTHVKGWNSGVKVYGYVDANGQDKFDIFVTTGSSHKISSTPIGSVVLVDGEPKFKLKGE
jgi:hypothetical protein